MDIDSYKCGLVIIAEDNYINKGYAIRCLKSFLFNNPWFNGDIIFFTDNELNIISEENKEKLKSYYNKVIFKDVKNFSEKYNYLLTVSFYSAGSKRFLHSYARFEIFNLEGYDKILCVDADIVFNDNILDLFEKDIKFGCTSSLRYFDKDIPFDYIYDSYEYIENTYCDSGGFNAGLLYLGNKFFMNKNIYNQILNYINEYVSNNKRLTYFEQDILNDFFYNNYKNEVTWISPLYSISIFTWDNTYDHNGNIVNFLQYNNLRINEALDRGKVFHFMSKEDLDTLLQNKKIKNIYNKY